LYETYPPFCEHPFGASSYPARSYEQSQSMTLVIWMPSSVTPPLSPSPPVKRDLAFTVDETVTAGQLENVIRKAAGANLESIELFDVFTGEQVGEGKKSLAYAVVFRSPSKTLSAEDSDAIRKAIVAEAAEIGAQLRA